jgi:HPt (histidine-containing phosphotransfer) domain-containing protein
MPICKEVNEWDEARYDEILSELRTVANLDVESGLVHLPCKADYIKVLRQYCKGLDEEINCLRRMEENNDWKDYSIRVHALKSVFANLGNQYLSHWALRLEKASAKREEKDIETCSEQTDGFCEGMDSFRSMLLQTSLMEDDEDTGEKSEIDAASLEKEISALDEACQVCDADQASEIADKLKQVTFSGETDVFLKDICELVESFDFDEVSEKCGELLETIRAVPV